MLYANTAFAMLQRYRKVSSLPLLKITTKSAHFLPAEKIPILRIELQTNNTKGLKILLKKLKIAKTFLKNVNKEATLFL